MANENHPLRLEAATAATEIVQGLREAAGRGWTEAILEIYVRETILKHLPVEPPPASPLGLVSCSELVELLDDMGQFVQQSKQRIAVLRESSVQPQPDLVSRLQAVGLVPTYTVGGHLQPPKEPPHVES